MASPTGAAAFVTANEFHNMYRNCFEGPYQPTYPSDDYLGVKSAILDLLTIDSGNREEKIIESAKKIKEIVTKTPIPSITSQLEEAAASVKNGKAFWKMFTFPFERTEAIRNIILSRIKVLQDDFMKHEVGDQRSLIKCFADASFFNKEIQDTSSKNYYKEGGNSNTKIGYAGMEKLLADGLISGNMYSEREISRLEAQDVQAANQFRNIRDEFTRRAKAGELIKDRLVMVNNFQARTISFTIQPNPNSTDIAYPYAITMNALVYDEIVNGRIHTEQEAMDFVKNTFISNPRFMQFTTLMYGAENSRMIFDVCWDSLRFFKEAFENIEKEDTKKS